MVETKYKNIPALSKWQSDSSVTFATRKDDRILAQIDFLVERYNHHLREGNGTMQTTIVSDLFFTLNTWVKLYHQKHPNVKPARYPAIMALFSCVVEILCEWLACRQVDLAQQLTFLFGADITNHGIFQDQIQQNARYFDKLERKMYRLFFKGGLAYQYPWWKLKTFAPLQPGGRMPPMRLELANSVHAYQPGMMRNKELPTPNYGTYVCSMEREFFMAKHSANVGEGSTVFHSAYTGGGPVIGAGSMLIEHGVVKGIRDDSGHYQPGATNMVGVLQALGMYGVRLSKVEIRSWDSKKPTILALEFLKKNMSWKAYLDNYAIQQPRHLGNNPTLTAADTVYSGANQH